MSSNTTSLNLELADDELDNGNVKEGSTLEDLENVVQPTGDPPTEILTDTVVKLKSLETEELCSLLYDMEKSLMFRLSALRTLYEIHGQDLIEYVRTLESLYNLSGSTSLEEFLFAISEAEWVTWIARLQSLKCLLTYREIFGVSERKRVRQEKAWGCLSLILNNPALDISTPYKLELIFLLSDSPYHVSEATHVYISLITDTSIEERYRYKQCLLGLERRELQRIREEDVLDSYISPETLDIFKECKITLHRDMDGNGDDLYVEPDEIKDGQIFSFFKKLDKPFPKMELLVRGGYAFFKTFNSWSDPLNKFGVLSGQYVLSWGLKYPDYWPDLFGATEKFLLAMAKHRDIPYNTRADCADVLLGMGSYDLQPEARDAIRLLGATTADGSLKTVRTFYEDAQNVHASEELDQSIEEVLTRLNTSIDYAKIKPFETVTAEILLYLEDPTSPVTDSLPVSSLEEISIKVKRALERITMDRFLYGQYSNSLTNVLCLVWAQIEQISETEKSLYVGRLLEELEEMTDTCSSGYVSRLCNVLSGYDGFNLKISYEEQITANVFGRVNAYIREISGSDLSHLFWSKNMKFIEDMYRNSIYGTSNFSSFQPERFTEQRMPVLSMVELTEKQKELKDLDSKNRPIDISPEDMQKWYIERVHDQMTVKESNHYDRKELTLLVNSYIVTLEQELRTEFVDSNLVSSTTFDGIYKDALVKYTSA